jgi:hypothetical protein
MEKIQKESNYKRSSQITRVRKTEIFKKRVVNRDKKTKKDKEKMRKVKMMKSNWRNRM